LDDGTVQSDFDFSPDIDIKLPPSKLPPAHRLAVAMIQRCKEVILPETMEWDGEPVLK
jgi:hypothetical protein